MNKINLVFFIVFQFCAQQLFSQKKYPFIQYDSNKIIHATDSSDFIAFYKKIDGLKNGGISG